MIPVTILCNRGRSPGLNGRRRTREGSGLSFTKGPQTGHLLAEGYSCEFGVHLADLALVRVELCLKIAFRKLTSAPENCMLQYSQMASSGCLCTILICRLSTVEPLTNSFLFCFFPLKHNVLLFELVGAVKTFPNLLMYLLELVQGLLGFHMPSFANSGELVKRPVKHCKFLWQKYVNGPVISL
jgi:hypothetical protein